MNTIDTTVSLLNSFWFARCFRQTFWIVKSCKSLHSIQYGLMKDGIVREQEKRSIDLYIKNIQRFHSSMSNLQNLTSIVLENCLEIKYFTLFNAYSINDLSSGNNEKRGCKYKMNDLKTIFFLNFNKLESHLLKMKSSISLVNHTCFKKECYSYLSDQTKLCTHQSWFRWCMYKYYDCKTLVHQRKWPSRQNVWAEEHIILISKSRVRAFTEGIISNSF